MQILLIRHGLAEKANAKHFRNDDLRPLTDKGYKSFKRAVKGLRTLSLKPKIILTSPTLRTGSTADLLARGLGLDAKIVRIAKELHHTLPPTRALAKLARMHLPDSIALVGHDPWLGEFLSLLIAGNIDAHLKLDKGGGALLEVDALKPGKGRLIWLITQAQFAALA